MDLFFADAWENVLDDRRTRITFYDRPVKQNADSAVGQRVRNPRERAQRTRSAERGARCPALEKGKNNPIGRGMVALRLGYDRRK